MPDLPSWLAGSALVLRSGLLLGARVLERGLVRRRDLLAGPGEATDGFGGLRVHVRVGMGYLRFLQTRCGAVGLLAVERGVRERGPEQLGQAPGLLLVRHEELHDR